MDVIFFRDAIQRSNEVFYNVSLCISCGIFSSGYNRNWMPVKRGCHLGITHWQTSIVGECSDISVHDNTNEAI